MKTNENKDLKEKNIKKAKKRVSIITLFLWIFLVTTMVTIIAQNVKNVNALDEDDEMESITYKNTNENFKGTFTVFGTPKVAIANKLRDNLAIFEYQGQWRFTVPIEKYYFELNDGWIFDYISVTGHTSINGASDKDYAEPGDELVFDDTSNVSIIYHFKKIESTFKLEYDTNCGETVPVTIFSQDAKTSDDSYTFIIPKIPEIINYRPGYEFLGWSRDPNGEPEYKANDSITINENTRLYAVWMEYASVKIPVSVKKVWMDNENEAGKRPESITLQVKNNGLVVAEQVVSDGNNWGHTFELPKYNETGYVINYTVDEKELDDEVSKFYIKNVVGNVITNTFVVPEDRVKIMGTKVWNDNGNAGGKRDTSVILQLKVGDNIISEAEVSDSNNWSYEFEAPKYDEVGNEIDYYIDERNTENKFYKKILTDKNTVTNEFVVPGEVVLVKAVKKWEDNNDEYSKRPESVVLQVYDGDKIIAEEKVSAENNWSYEFELPKYDELGDEIKYTVDEKSTSKYYEKTIEGYTVINKCIYEPVVDTSDMNVIIYVIIFFIAIIGVIVGIVCIKNKKK